jgi:hypothetical protein
MLMTAGFALPAIAFAAGPIFTNQNLPWQTVGYPDDFPDDNYVPVVITIAPGIGEAGKSTVYMRKRNPMVDKTPETQYNHWVAISTRCAHLGCPVRWVPAGRAFHLPVSRRRLRPRRCARRRSAATPARPLLHPRLRRLRPGRSALQRQQRAARLLATRSGRAARRHRPVPLPVASERSQALSDAPHAAQKAEASAPSPADPAAVSAAAARGHAARSPKGPDRGRRGREVAGRLDRRAHLAVGRRTLDDVPQGAEGHQLVLHARLGDDDRLPLPGRDRRLPRDVLPPRRRRRRLRVDPLHHRRTSSSASSCAACTSGARR